MFFLHFFEEDVMAGDSCSIWGICWRFCKNHQLRSSSSRKEEGYPWRCISRDVSESPSSFACFTLSTICREGRFGCIFVTSSDMTLPTFRSRNGSEHENTWCSLCLSMLCCLCAVIRVHFLTFRFSFTALVTPLRIHSPFGVFYLGWGHLCGSVVWFSCVVHHRESKVQRRTRRTRMHRAFSFLNLRSSFFISLMSLLLCDSMDVVIESLRVARLSGHFTSFSTWDKKNDTPVAVVEETAQGISVRTFIFFTVRVSVWSVYPFFVGDEDQSTVRQKEHKSSGFTLYIRFPSANLAFYIPLLYATNSFFQLSLSTSKAKQEETPYLLICMKETSERGSLEETPLLGWCILTKKRHE